MLAHENKDIDEKKLHDEEDYIDPDDNKPKEDSDDDEPKSMSRGEMDDEPNIFASKEIVIIAKHK